MSLSKIFLIALTLMGSVRAVAIAKRVDPNNQSCTHKFYLLFESYNVLIGVPYAGSSGCDSTYNALEHGAGTLPDGAQNDGTWVTDWHCVEEDGYVHL